MSSSSLCKKKILVRKLGGRAMYLETYSMEELMELIEEKRILLCGGNRKS